MTGSVIRPIFDNKLSLIRLIKAKKGSKWDLWGMNRKRGVIRAQRIRQGKRVRKVRFVRKDSLRLFSFFDPRRSQPMSTLFSSHSPSCLDSSFACSTFLAISQEDSMDLTLTLDNCLQLFSPFRFSQSQVAKENGVYTRLLVPCFHKRCRRLFCTKVYM